MQLTILIGILGMVDEICHLLTENLSHCAPDAKSIYYAVRKICKIRTAKATTKAFDSKWHSCLSRKFREETGDSINTYIKKARIELAKVLLLNSDDNMDEIAVKCGFLSRSFFTAAFIKECGISPAKYRPTMRRD